jgi:hypothetical protein
MKTRNILWIRLVLICNLVFCDLVHADRLKTYPLPRQVERNSAFSVWVRSPQKKWQSIDVCAWKVDHVVNGFHKIERSSVASFDFEGKVEVCIKYNAGRIDSCKVRPLSDHILLIQKENSICFTLDSPKDLSIEMNGDIYHNLQLFANEIALTVKRSKNVIYYGPGYYNLKNDSIKVSSRKTLYIAGGAYIKGFISVDGAHDVKIIGHGYVNPERQQEGILVRYSKNVLVDGPLTTQIPVGQSDSVMIRNVKVMSWYGWGDGMNIFASRHVYYDHVFCRTSDDCSTIYCTRKGYHGGCKDIRVNDAVYWADVAHPIMIGLHGDIMKNETIQDVVYNNIDILQQNEKQLDYEGCIGINDGDNNLVKNLLFQNIRIENISEGMLFNFRVCFNKKYCHAPGRGIHDIMLRNISYIGKRTNISLLTGYSDDRDINGIHFENLTINGIHIYDNMPGKPTWYKTSDFAGIYLGEFVHDVSFK